MTPTRWRDFALCRGTNPEVFYSGEPDDKRHAFELCASCPVRLPCREAGAHERFGIWGGVNHGTTRHRTRARAS